MSRISIFEINAEFDTATFVADMIIYSLILINDCTPFRIPAFRPVADVPIGSYNFYVIRI